MEFKIEWFDSLPSTNTALRERIREDSNMLNGTLFVAREQTAGRGRADRKWIAPAGKNLCFSVFIKTQAPLLQLPSLTMAAAMGVGEWLRTLSLPAQPKWPNDLLVGGKKICGILSERVEGSGAILGIGLNINMTPMEAAAIDRPATSLFIETQQTYLLEEALQDLLSHLGAWIDRWETEGFSGFREVWTAQAGPIGKPLTVHCDQTLKTGTLAGFGEYGELLLQTDTGLETIWSGEIPLQ